MGVSKLKVWKEATVGVVPSPIAVAYSFKSEGFDLTASQDKETNNLFGSGRGASAPTYGVDSISGGIPSIFGVDNALIWLTHAIGGATATAPASASLWVMATVTTVGTIVNHSDTLHSLVCYSVSGTGTTGATEPDLSAYTTAELGRGATIIDNAGANQVVWVIMPKLYNHSGVRADCLSSFGVEVTDSYACEAGVDSFSRYVGIYINSMGLSLNGDTKGIKVTLDCMGVRKEDSILDEVFTPLTITLDKTLDDDFFSFDGCTLKIDGVNAQQFISFDITISNNVDMKNGFNKTKIDDVGIVSVTGSLSAIFETELYKATASHVNKSAEIILVKANGGKMTIKLPQFQMEKTDKTFEVGKKTMLNPNFEAFDTPTSPSIEWSCTSTLATY